MYFVIFVLMAQFVLVNVVVAVLMKHLEESHHQMDEDEDHEIDLEIAKEIEAEKKALIEAKERRQRDKNLKVRRPLMKMASLPSNFTFSCLPMTPLEELQVGEAMNVSQWTNQSSEVEKKRRRHGSKKEHREKSSHGGTHVTSNQAVGRGEGPAVNEANEAALRASLTCDSIFQGGTGPAGTRSVAGNGQADHQSVGATSPASLPIGILRKSHSLRAKSSKPSFIDSLKKTSLYRKNGTDVRNGTTKKEVDEEASPFLSNLEEDEPSEDAHLHLSKSTEAISNLERKSCRAKGNSRNGSVKSNKSREGGRASRAKSVKAAAGMQLPLDDADWAKSAITASPITITIETNYLATNLPIDPLPQQDKQSIDQTKQQQQQPIKFDLLSTATAAQTTNSSPSRVTSNGLRHRKLSDFLDEESAPLSPGVLSAYPEFNNDVTTYEEDLNVLDEDEEANEQFSLASAESWPSAEAIEPSPSSATVILDMSSLEQSDPPHSDPV